MKRILIVGTVLSALFAGFAQAETYEGDTRTTVLTRTGKNLRHASILTADVVAPIFRVHRSLDWVTVPVIDLDCSNIPGDGKGNWHGFFNVSRTQKPAALAEAIKGVGIKTAEQLVNRGFFNRKPRTWQEFSSVIIAADRELRTGFSHQVLSTYGQENASNLGYYSSGSCRYVTKLELVLQEVTRRIPAGSNSKHFEFEIEGALLLNGESERINASFNGFEATVSVDSIYNSYRKNCVDRGSTVVCQMVASRKLVTPANSLSLIPSNVGGIMTVKIVDNNFDAETARESGTPVVQIKVVKNRKFWLDKEIATVERELNLNDAVTVINTGIRPGDSGDYYVAVRIKRVGGSRFFAADKLSDKRESSKVKF